MDNGADGQWMTYAELGAARGISKESALKLALRHKWPKQTDNHGTIRVSVPADWIGTRTAGADIERRVHSMSVSPDGQIAALSDHIASLKDQLAKAEAAREQEREAHGAERAKAEAALQKAESRAADDIAWHRAEIERLNLAAAKPWWRKMLGR